MSEKVPVEGRRYVLVVPVRDEERFLEASLAGFVEQTVRPSEVVVVNDGSTGRTAEIAERYAQEYSWIQVVHREDRGDRKLGGGVIDTFYAGYDALNSTDFDFICKIDGDITFEAGYFEALMMKFDENPKLGGASGKTWNPVGDRLVEERLADEMAAGQVNFWSRRCWDDIGGYVRKVMWDGIVFHRARMCGWKTKSFRDPELQIIYHRLMGSRTEVSTMDGCVGEEGSGSWERTRCTSLPVESSARVNGLLSWVVF